MHEKARTTVLLTQDAATSLDDAFWDDALWPVTHFAQPSHIIEDLSNLPHPRHIETNLTGRPFNAKLRSLNVDDRPPLMSG
ncbi:MAG: hypothetical protein ACR2PG_22070 [Hyphomicrobiaceae bacterium]